MTVLNEMTVKSGRIRVSATIKLWKKAYEERSTSMLSTNRMKLST